MNTSSAPVRFEGIHCQITITRPASGVAVLAISGTDIGEFGDAVMRELQNDFAPGRALALFFDARDVKGASIEVSHEWVQWMSAQRDSLAQVSMLTGNRYVRMTADFARRFAGLQGTMRIYTDAQAFYADLQAAVAAAGQQG